MKIDNLFPGFRSAPGAAAKTGKAQAGNFRQALGAAPQEPKDTFTLSSRALAAAEETPAMPGSRPVIQSADGAVPKDAASATEILPGDSAKVKLAKLHQMLEEADYTGMGFDEIRTDIYNRFNDAFNGNMSSILTFSCCGGAGGPEGEGIMGQFWREIRDHVWIPMHREFEAETGIRSTNPYPSKYIPSDFGTEESKAYAEYVSAKYGDMDIKMLGYGDMSIEEVEQAILRKYAGKGTLRDFLNMQGELYHSGVLASKLTGWGASACVNAIDDQLVKTYFPSFYWGFDGTTRMDIPQSSWDAVLDGRFDVRAFAADMRETLKNSSYFGYSFDIEGAISKAIAYMLEAVDKAQLENHERLTEQVKRERQEEILQDISVEN